MAKSAALREFLGLAGWLAVSFAAAAVGGFASVDAGSFYQGLSRPEWAPPGWLFGPVWSLLYLLMGVAAWLVWKAQGWRNAATALSLFLVQLAVNALWSWLFFVWRLGQASFVEVLVLWALIVWTLVTFWRVRPLAGYLLAPYLLWVSFASVLTYAVWQRNPQLLS
jgi:benzodiazapine receptor